MEIMELPYVFRTRLGTVPDKVPYFDLDAIRKAGQLDLSTNDRGRLKVGLVWDSSRWDTSRSLPKGCMDVWKEIKSVEWFSLQQGSENREVQLPIQAHYFGDDTQEITQAAAVILQMDLVITVDTLVAHLAGALGCPVWLLLSYNPDWRWQSQGSRSAWYPTMRIFRCPQPEAWRATAQMVGRALIDKSKSVHAETI
jgi:hypothetical protein